MFDFNPWHTNVLINAMKLERPTADKSRAVSHRPSFMKRFATWISHRFSHSIEAAASGAVNESIHRSERGLRRRGKSPYPRARTERLRPEAYVAPEWRSADSRDPVRVK